MSYTTRNMFCKYHVRYHVLYLVCAHEIQRAVVGNDHLKSQAPSNNGNYIYNSFRKAT